MARLSTACISPACIVLIWILPVGLCYYKVSVFQVQHIWIELCKMYPAWWFWTLGMFRPVKFSLQAVLKCGILLLIFMHPICSLLTFPFVILHCFMIVLVLFCVCLTYYNLFLFYQIPLHSLRILEYYSSIVFILSVFGTIVLVCFYFNILVNPTINDYFRFRYFRNPQGFTSSRLSGEQFLGQLDPFRSGFLLLW